MEFNTNAVEGLNDDETKGITSPNSIDLWFILRTAVLPWPRNVSHMMH